jgi:hypothetical protein
MLIEANRAYAVAVTGPILLLAGLTFGFWTELPTFLAFVVFAALLLGGIRFILFVGPARLLSRSWVAADQRGISTRNVRGIERYEWDRVISVAWWHSWYPPLARCTVIEVMLKLGDPNDPYGPINPLEVSLFFLSRKQRSLEIGREFLSVCRRYGVRTILLVGRARESLPPAR